MYRFARYTIEVPKAHPPYIGHDERQHDTAVEFEFSRDYCRKTPVVYQINSPADERALLLSGPEVAGECVQQYERMCEIVRARIVDLALYDPSFIPAVETASSVSSACLVARGWLAHYGISSTDDECLAETLSNHATLLWKSASISRLVSPLSA